MPPVTTKYGFLLLMPFQFGLGIGYNGAFQLAPATEVCLIVALNPLVSAFMGVSGLDMTWVGWPGEVLHPATPPSPRLRCDRSDGLICLVS